MSFIFKTLDLDSQYQKILNMQKDLIKNNKYVRELEEKYHKPGRKYTNSSSSKKKTDVKIHNWPVESKLFTKVLKSRLDLVFTPSTGKNILKESKSISYKPASKLRYASFDGKTKDLEKLEINLCADKPQTQKNPERKVALKYRLGHLKSNSVNSPLKKQSKYRIEKSFNDSIENYLEEDFRDIHLIRIPRYN